MINVSTLFHFFWVFFHISVPRTFATEKFINHYLSILSMKILNFWTVALMALSFSTTFVSCGDDNDINLVENDSAIRKLPALIMDIQSVNAICSQTICWAINPAQQ